MRRSLRKAHTRTWMVFSVIIPLIVVLAVWKKQDPSKLPAPVQTAPAVESSNGS